MLLFWNFVFSGIIAEKLGYSEGRTASEIHLIRNHSTPFHHIPDGL